ncbi:MAG TPA: secretin N-terminal domain-containing protein, partial [Clostridia bacterium]|nr:secretin N-terminal domain-containing protein [Clostridia bacterium]
MKNILLAFFLTGVLLQAQPASPPATPVAPGTATNRQETLQRTLRDALANPSAARVLTPAATNPAPSTKSSANVSASANPNAGPSLQSSPIPAPTPPPNSIIVPNTPTTSGGTNEEAMIAIAPPPNATNAPPEELLPAGTINFPATDLNQVLQIYAELVNRTILRPTTLPAPTITLKTQTPLTRAEARQAFDAVLALNGITMIDVGDKFVKAVPQAQANQEAARFNKLTADQLPELGQYVTHVVQLKYIKPTEMVQVLQPFAKIPNAILPIDSSQILVLRDNTENVKRMLEMIREVDVAVPSEFISEVIPIKYALSSEIANALNSLSSGGGGATVGGSGTTGAGGARTSFGGSSRSSGFGRSMTGGGGYGGGGYPGSSPMGTMAAGTATPGGAGAAGGSFTDRLRNIIQRASVSGDIVVLGQTKIIADERTNSLLIFASREDMKMIKDIVAKLDVVLAQVLIEAVIIEVGLKNSSELGVSYL